MGARFTFWCADRGQLIEGPGSPEHPFVFVFPKLRPPLRFKIQKFLR
jgi:hypothetical protein